MTSMDDGVRNISQCARNVGRTKIFTGKMYEEGSQWTSYLHLYCGFDIETTSFEDNSYMYIWQFSIATDRNINNPIVIFGRTWSEFEYLIKKLRRMLTLRESTRMIIWVANLSYEFSFIRKLFEWDQIFAKEPRQPLLAVSGGIEFREALSISGGNLAYLAKTYCKTQKMVGDLDYDILRNSKTELTDEELAYCRNDVVILSEFSQYIFQQYIIPERYIPLTSTMILRHELKQRAKERFGKLSFIYDIIKSLFPKTMSEYIFDMWYLFRGGFVHGEYSSMLHDLFDLEGFDLKSSYPSYMLKGYVPISPFEDYKPKDTEDFFRILDKYCVKFVITFKNIRAKTKHSIESTSKCIELKNPLIDNGRVRRADMMKVYLTELDFQTYMDFYTWDSFSIESLQIAKRGTLPDYLKNMVYELFELKESIDKKANPQGYAISKTKVNGMFGMCCTRLCFEDIQYNQQTDKWESVPSEKDYNYLISSQVLSPYWGIYITAGARRVICKLLADLDGVVYTDTDSHKFKLTRHNMRVVHEFNKRNHAMNQLCCDTNGYSMDIIGKLGALEWETSPKDMGRILHFRGAGAKRYICQYANAGFVSTIAGLGKGVLNSYCKELGTDAFELFDKNMVIPKEKTGKLRAIYNDAPVEAYITDNQGNTELMKELSNVCLVPVEFTMSMDPDYLALIYQQTRRLQKHGTD